MQTKQRAIVGVLVICALFFFQINRNSSRNNLTKDDIKDIIETVEQSFVKAEASVLNIDPVDPDTPSGPDPDPEKCICKGTGKIIQGDGHITPCPYHASSGANVCQCGCNKEECSCNSQFKQPIRRRRWFGIFR